MSSRAESSALPVSAATTYWTGRSWPSSPASASGSQRAPSWETSTAVTTWRGNSGVAAPSWWAAVWLCTDIEVRAPVRWTAVDACARVGGGGASRTAPHTNGWAGPTARRLWTTHVRRAVRTLRPKAPGRCVSCRGAVAAGASGRRARAARAVLRPTRLLQPAALPLGQAAPDAEPLVVGEGVLQAFGADLAGEADLLGLAGGAALLGEEGLGVGLGAQRALLPAEFLVRVVEPAAIAATARSCAPLVCLSRPRDVAVTDSGRTTRVKLQVCCSGRVKPRSAIGPLIHSAEPRP